MNVMILHDNDTKSIYDMRESLLKYILQLDEYAVIIKQSPLWLVPQKNIKIYDNDIVSLKQNGLCIKQNKIYFSVIIKKLDSDIICNMLLFTVENFDKNKGDLASIIGSYKSNFMIKHEIRVFRLCTVEINDILWQITKQKWHKLHINH